MKIPNIISFFFVQLSTDVQNVDAEAYPDDEEHSQLVFAECCTVLQYIQAHPDTNISFNSSPLLISTSKFVLFYALPEDI